MIRRLAPAALLLGACGTHPRHVLVVEPGAALVCTVQPAARADVTAADVTAADVTAADVTDAGDAADVPDASDADVPDAQPVPDIDLARLALLPATTRAWSVLRVARCEGARAVLVGRDGSASTRPLTALHAAALAPGVEVMALWNNAGTAYHAVVLEARGDALRVRYDDGTEEALDPSRLTSVTLASTPAPARVCPPRPGALPAVLVADAQWHPAAAVVECGGASALVETLRDGRRLVPAGALSTASLQRGDRVMVRWRDGHDWAATVREVEARALEVTYDDGSEESVRVGQVTAWSAPPERPRATSPYRCP